MKINFKPSLSDYITIVVGIGAVIAASYTTEIRNMIDGIIAHWQFVLFWGGIFMLLWRFTHIVLRTRMENKLNEKFDTLEKT